MQNRDQHRDSALYIPSLDGIRALAASLVFLGHASGAASVIPAGFGVTIFFFLSGYLITTLMRQEYTSTGSVSFRKFYLRRVYRIFPPFYLVLLLAFTLAMFGILEHDMMLVPVLSQLLHFTNYYYILFGGDHFVPATSIYWSLAVEEHFYAVFPLIFIFSMQFRGGKHAALIFAGICVVGLLWRFWLTWQFNVPGDNIYHATDTRFDSLLYGCILGVWRNPVVDAEWKISAKARFVVLLVAGAVLLFTFVFRDAFFRQTMRYSLQGMALLPIFWLAIRHPDWLVFRWLNTRPVRFLGTISYTFYLSHVVMLNISEEQFHLHGLARGISAFLMTFTFATIMYYLIERHMADLRRKLHG